MGFLIIWDFIKYKARFMGKLQRRAGTWNAWGFQLHDRTPVRSNPMHVHDRIQFVAHGILNHMGLLNVRLVA